MTTSSGRRVPFLKHSFGRGTLNRKGVTMGNEKKLDNTNIAKDNDIEFMDESEPTIDSLIDEDEIFGEDAKIEFDEEGNLIGLDDNEPVEDKPVVDDADKQAQPTQVVPEVKPEVQQSDKDKANKSPSPADIKVINLKKENKALQQQLAEALKVRQAQELEQEKERLRSSYVEQGYDADTAKTMSANEIRLRQLEDQLQLANFREENSDILALYPEAKANISSIMKNSKLTGMTVEQICKGLYGTPTVPDYENRALMAAKGQSTRDTGSKTNIVPAKTETDVILTRAQQKEKTFLERLNGGKLSNEEYKKFSRL